LIQRIAAIAGSLVSVARLTELTAACAAVSAIADIRPTAVAAGEENAKVVALASLWTAARLEFAKDDRGALTLAAGARAAGACLEKLPANDGSATILVEGSEPALEARAARVGDATAQLAVSATDRLTDVANAHLARITADAVAAGRAVAAVARFLADTALRATAVGVVEIEGDLAVGGPAALAALAFILAAPLQRKAARADAVLGVAKPFAAVTFRFTRLLGQRATVAGDALLAVEDVLAAICRRLAATLRVMAAHVRGALADAGTAALAVVAA
jgi:hypothetical protein